MKVIPRKAIWLFGLLLAIAALSLIFPVAEAQEGTPTIVAPLLQNPVTLDGEISGDEWADAGQLSLTFVYTHGESSLTYLGTIYLKHDGTYLWICIRVQDDDENKFPEMSDYAAILFDANGDGDIGPGDDSAIIHHGMGTEDLRPDEEEVWRSDTEFGGNNDVTGASGWAAGWYTYEMRKPLNSGDTNGYDIAISPGDTILSSSCIWDAGETTEWSADAGSFYIELESLAGPIGVKVGDWANYHATGSIPEPEFYILRVTDVSGNNVTIQVDMYYESGEKESLTCTGDPIAGTGLLYDILAPGGLSPGDQFTIWLENEIGYVGPVTIDETTSRTYAGESREVNHVTIYGCDLYYDKETGIFCEGIYGSYYLVVMTETNMWGPASAIIPEPQSVTETNPTTIDAVETANAMVIVSNISDSCIIKIENATEAPPPPSGLQTVGNSILIDTSKMVTTIAVLRISYDPAELSAKGIAESSLTIHYWDGSAWVPVESHVNAEEQYVWSEIDHFSYWTLMGETAPSEEGLPIIWILVPIVGVVVAVLVLLYFRWYKRG